MGFECRFFRKGRGGRGDARGEKSAVCSAEGTGNEFRSACLSAEKRGFAGCRHTSRKA